MWTRDDTEMHTVLWKTRGVAFHPALEVWWEGTRERFPLLRIREDLLEVMFEWSPNQNRGANKAQDVVGNAFLAEGTA